MDQERRTAFLKRLVCPRCRKRYTENDLLANGAEGSPGALDVRCVNCQLRIRLELPKPRPRGRARRRERAASSPRRGGQIPVSDDDVLQVHLLLANFRGGMDQLLRQL